MKYPVPALGPERRSARPRGEVHLVLVICLDWLSLPRKSVEMIRHVKQPGSTISQHKGEEKGRLLGSHSSILPSIGEGEKEIKTVKDQIF